MASYTKYVVIGFLPFARKTLHKMLGDPALHELIDRLSRQILPRTAEAPIVVATTAPTATPTATCTATATATATAPAAAAAAQLQLPLFISFPD